MDWGIVSGVITAVLLAAFVAVVIWAYGKARRKAFEEAARYPLFDEGDRL